MEAISELGGIFFHAGSFSMHNGESMESMK